MVGYRVGDNGFWKASVCIPVRDGATTIGRALEGAVAQLNGTAEVIVADDGSTDGTLAEVRKWGERVKVVHANRRGGNAARNAAWQAAQGEWIQFLDADDALEPWKIERQLASRGTKDEAEVLLSPVVNERAGGNRDVTALPSHGDWWRAWLGWAWPQTGGVLWHRDALEKLGGWDEAFNCCQDFEMYLRVLTGGLKVKAMDGEPGAIYSLARENSVSRGAQITRVIEVKTALLDAAAAWLEDRQSWTPERAATAGQTCFEMARLLAARDHPRACAYAAERQRRGRV